MLKTIWNALVGVWNWLVLSSADPSEAALTVKGLVVGAGTYIIFFAGLFHITVGTPDIANLANQGALIAGGFLMVVSGITTLYGIYRKLWTTIAGTNQVINAQKAADTSVQQ